MKLRILFSITFLTLFISCKKETPITATNVIEKPKAPRDACYVYDFKGSKIELELHYIADSDSISGRLNFAFAEKDSNKGTIQGKFTDAVLIADYTFQSEGTESIRQVAIQLNDDKAILGYGELTQDGTRFKDVSKVKFDSGVPLIKVECKK